MTACLLDTKRHMQPTGPILSASIFCDRRLDEVIWSAVGPWLNRVREDYPTESWKLWWLRYARNGDHVKIRLHGPARHRQAAERLLVESTDRFFASLPAADPAQERRNRPSAPPVDPEDETGEMYPDRTLMWTRFRRSPVCFGPLFLEDHDYIARITSCLACGAELVLNARWAASGVLPEGVRHHVVLRAILAGLGGATLSREERVVYLTYHRDWLLRTIGTDGTHEAKVRTLFDRRLEATPDFVQQLREITAVEWSDADLPADTGAESQLRTGVEALRRYVAAFRFDPDQWGDPFAHDASFPLVFKALHGIANQAGADMVTEAFFHHALLTAISEVPAPRFAAVAG